MVNFKESWGVGVLFWLLALDARAVWPVHGRCYRMVAVSQTVSLWLLLSPEMLEAVAEEREEKPAHRSN